MADIVDDPIVREIREIREALSEECGHDLRRFGEMIVKRQEESGREYVYPRKKAEAGGEET